jgi:hypothetical protein
MSLGCTIIQIQNEIGNVYNVTVMHFQLLSLFVTFNPQRVTIFFIFQSCAHIVYCRMLLLLLLGAVIIYLRITYYLCVYIYFLKLLVINNLKSSPCPNIL